MDNNVFYNDVECIFTNEGKSLFVKQANGIKFSNVGAVLFSDIRNAIKEAYETGQDNNFASMRTITFKQLQNFTTVIFKNVSYNLEGNAYIPENEEQYKNASNDINNILPIQIAYGNRHFETEEEAQPKYSSYNFILGTKGLSINRNTDMNFDGFVLVGLPYKQIQEEQKLSILKPQSYSILAIIYFPKEGEKLQILKNQPNKVAMNFELHFKLQDPIDLSELEYITNKGLTPNNPKRFTFGLHLTNDGLNDRGN